MRGFTVLILVAFGLITLCGVKESSTVTLFLFSVHTLTITILIIWGFVYGCQDGFKIFSDNMYSTLPVIKSSEGDLLADRSVPASIYYGYCSALLGITGFETASNYVEDLKSPETFVSTVNWMWGLVGIYNPIISIVSMMVLPMGMIYAHPSDMLAEMAKELGGTGFETWLCINAVMILCGGVLTAIVGVSGLIERLAKDKVVPEELAVVYPWGASYASIIGFVIFCICLFLCIFDPEDPTGINRFGGVFAISFLSVLAAFAFAAMLLKVYRPNLARLIITKWWHVIFSFSAVFVGLIGNHHHQTDFCAVLLILLIFPSTCFCTVFLVLLIFVFFM
jgi:amino acid transporter